MNTQNHNTGETSAAERDPHAIRAVDNTDWLKTAAIILVVVDHIGYFFMEDDLWWSVFGRLAAPTFFFFMGYALTRRIPLQWIGLGIMLTLLESWNEDWAWVTANILLSFAFIRLVRPYLQFLVQRFDWIAFVLLAAAIVASSPIASKVVDFGAEGWLWALFGLCQRLYLDGRPAAGADGAAPGSAPSANSRPRFAGLMRLAACLVAAVVYIWLEDEEYSYPRIPFSVFVFGVGALSICLCRFGRGPSRIQPPSALAFILRFIGRHTLEIYAIQLAVSELVVKFFPDLAP